MLSDAVDERQRGAEFVGNIDEEVHPGLVQLLDMGLFRLGKGFLLLALVMPPGRYNSAERNRHCGNEIA